MVFATEQTVRSRTYAERVRILDQDTVVDEVALSGDLVRSIESLLPVQKCHTQEDFERLFSLYHVDGWDCDTSEWRELVDTYFCCIRDCQNDSTCSSLSGACLSSSTPIFLSTDNTS